MTDDFWNDPERIRSAMMPPLTLRAALRAAKKAGISRIVFRGVTFEVGERESAPATFNEWDQDLGTSPTSVRQ